MTTIPFSPSDTAAPAFQANVTLDGTAYNFIAMWNVYSQRFFFSLYDQGGNRILTQPLIGSPQDDDIPLAYGLFITNTLVYRETTGNIEIGP